MKIHKLLTYFIACSIPLFTLGACGHNDHDHEHEGHDHDHEHEQAEEAGEHHHGDEIVLSAERAKAAGVEVQRVSPVPFLGVTPVGGKVLPAAGQEATVAATMSGVVHLNAKYNAGAPVSAGTSLFTISTAKLADGDLNRRTAVALEKAKTDYERTRKLAEENLATAAELSAAKAEYESARIAHEAGGAGGPKGVSSPMSGYVQQCLVKEGDFVEVGQPMMYVTQNRRLQLRAEVPERDFHTIGNIVSAKFRPAYSDHAYDLRTLNGRVASVGKSTDGGSPFIPVIFEFDNAAGIVPGSYAEVFLLSGTPQQVITAPVDAVTEEQGIYYVYVRLDDDCYRKQEVTLGRSDGDRYEILSGLKANDLLVTKGAMRVRLASASTAIPGHTHNH